jgi:ABC-type transporter Mla MlaB component
MDNYNIEYIPGKNGQPNQLIYSGELTFNYIQYIKDETVEAIKPNQSLSILVKDVDMLDLSFIQLLISMKHMNPDNSINLDVNKEVLDLIKVSGFEDVLV